MFLPALVLSLFALPMPARANLSLLSRIDGTAPMQVVGASVASAGDVDGDGRAEILIGAPLFGGNAGAAYLYDHDGVTLLAQINGAANAQLGYCVASAGDVDGDGRPEILIGAPSPTAGGGAAYLYDHDGTTLLAQINGPAGARFGQSVASAGDVDGDGRAEILIGAYEADPGGRADAGSAYLYDHDGTTLLAQIDGAAAGDKLGYSVASAGDVDGDGRAEILIGAYYAAPGGRADAGSTYLYDHDGATLLAQIDGPGAGDKLGTSVASAGDVDGDGRAEILIGATDGGLGGPGGPGSVYLYDHDGTTLMAQINGDAVGDSLGNYVASAGDVDGDGRAEILIGATFADPGGRANAGSIYLYDHDGTTLLTRIDGAAAGDRLYSVASAGDVDGDGASEFLIGSPGAQPGGNNMAGSAYLYKWDTLPPAQSAWNPAAGSLIGAAAQTITLATNENATCRWALTDQAYDAMANTCAGAGATGHSCDITGMVHGANTVSIACTDASGNKDTAATNHDLSYTVDITPPAIAGAANPAAGGTLPALSQTITFTTDENATCRWALSDQAYDAMADTCAGAGATSHSCGITGMAEGANTVSIACADAFDNKDTAATNHDLSYTVYLGDRTPPVQSAHNPAAASTITTRRPTVTFTTDETATCKWALADQAYDAMANTCTGAGATSHSCATSGLAAEGSGTIWFACVDAAGNKDTAATNTEITYTVTLPDYTTNTGSTFVYICPPVSDTARAAITVPRELVGDAYTDVDLASLAECKALAANITTVVALKADATTGPTTFTLQNGWNLIHNPYEQAIAYGGEHFSLTVGDTTAAINNAAVKQYISDFVYISTGNGQLARVPGQAATIPAFNAFMIKTSATGATLTITP